MSVPILIILFLKSSTSSGFTNKPIILSSKRCGRYLFLVIITGFPNPVASNTEVNPNDNFLSVTGFEHIIETDDLANSFATVYDESNDDSRDPFGSIK